MTDNVAVREPDDEDVSRIHEITERTLTASYALSPKELDGILASRFGEDRIEDWMDRDDVVALVAEVDGPDGRTVAGVVEGAVDDDGTGEIRWLFVHPQQQGRGAGTALFEHVRERLEDRDVDRVTASTLEANTEGHQFFESFEFKRVGEHYLDIGEETFLEYVYGEPDATVETDAGTEAGPGEAESFPETEGPDDRLRVTTEDGEELYVHAEEGYSGSGGAFFGTYRDESFEDQYGYYCSNCGSLRVAMDNEDRLECSECGNRHQPRSSESYDGAYL
jgi:ribosomal protein S18 acetylase RimI-like enzyme